MTLQAARARIELLRRQAGGAGDPLLTWTAVRRVNLRTGVEFDLVRHPYLVGLYTCAAQEMVVCKASQVGASEFLVSYALHAADVRGATVLYLFPTDRDISEFSAGRLGPAIEASPYLTQITGKASSGARGVDRVKLKRVRDRFVYLRGAQVKPDGSAPQLKSIDADVLIFDEVDEMDRRAPAIARHRLDHSEIAEVRWVSTPTWAGMGIHAQWLASDKRLWFVRCDACGQRQDLTIQDVVVEWDNLERPVRWHGDEFKAFPVCRKCGAPLDRLGPGEWVAEFPERPVAGFHLTKLFAPTVDLLTVVHHLQTVDETARKEAYNQDLGLPYTPRGGRFTAAELDAARRDYAHGGQWDAAQVGFIGATVAGVDVGAVLHVVVRRQAGAEWRQVWAGSCAWDELGATLTRYGVRAVVMDALPETEQARKFQAAWRGSVWLAYYVPQARGLKKADAVEVKRADGVVNLDRTRTLDAVFAGLRDGTLTLPAHARDIPDYYAHLTALARRVEQKADEAVAVYAGDGADHLAHAENYCRVAAGLLPASLGKQDGLKKERQW